jgi:hypothetical protein
VRISLRDGIVQAEGDPQAVYDLLGVLIGLGIERITLVVNEKNAAMMWAAARPRG